MNSDKFRRILVLLMAVASASPLACTPEQQEESKTSVGINTEDQRGGPAPTSQQQSGPGEWSSSNVPGEEQRKPGSVPGSENTEGKTPEGKPANQKSP